jgi:hypothetical protein
LYGDIGGLLSGGRGGGAFDTNLIEESMREDYDYSRPLRESRESDPNNLSGSSRLRVHTEIEKSRKESVSAKENKDSGNFVIKKTTTAAGLTSSPLNDPLKNNL